MADCIRVAVSLTCGPTLFSLAGFAFTSLATEAGGSEIKIGVESAGDGALRIVFRARLVAARSKGAVGNMGAPRKMVFDPRPRPQLACFARGRTALLPSPLGEGTRDGIEVGQFVRDESCHGLVGVGLAGLFSPLVSATHALATLSGGCVVLDLSRASAAGSGVADQSGEMDRAVVGPVTVVESGRLRDPGGELSCRRAFHLGRRLVERKALRIRSRHIGASGGANALKFWPSACAVEEPIQPSRGGSAERHESNDSAAFCRNAAMVR